MFLTECTKDTELSNRFEVKQINKLTHKHFILLHALCELCEKFLEDGFIKQVLNLILLFSAIKLEQKFYDHMGKDGHHME